VNDPSPTPPSVPVVLPRPPGLLCKAALWLLPLTALVLLALVPLALEPWLEGKVREAAGLAGLEIAPETEIEVAVFGGRITLLKLDLREVIDGQPRSLLKADRAELDADVLACLGGDIVLDSVKLEGASGDLRRRGDGTIPLATPPPEERGGTDWGKLDWWSYAKKAYEWQKGEDAKAEQAEEQPAKAEEPGKPPKKKPAHDWTGASQYEPAPGPRGPSMRVLIRDLAVSGRELLLPDDTPFAVTSFSATGKNLGWGRRDKAADWGLDLQAQTRDAGSLDLGFGRGRVRAIAKQLPLKALAHPALAGEAIAKHGASGIADLTLDARWTKQLDGTIQAKVTGLKLEPQPPTQTSQIVNRLGGRPLDWTMKLGGTPEDPQVTDDGLEALAKGSLADAAKQAAIEEGTKKLEEQLQKNEKLKELEQKNPEVKKAKDKAGELLKGLGK